MHGNSLIFSVIYYCAVCLVVYMYKNLRTAIVYPSEHLPCRIQHGYHAFRQWLHHRRRQVQGQHLGRLSNEGRGKPEIDTNILTNIRVRKPGHYCLIHWDRVTPICVGKLTIIGSDNGLEPSRRQAIIWTSAGILLIGPLGTYFSEILIEIYISFKEMHLKLPSGNWRPFCFGLNVLHNVLWAIDANTYLNRFEHTVDKPYNKDKLKKEICFHLNFACFPPIHYLN